MTNSNDIAAYYDRKATEAARLSVELQEARERGAGGDEIRRLERELERARYVGD